MLIKKYTADWIKNFESLKLEIEKGLSEVDYQIEHVGSTSVPQLDAKDIIDMDIIYHENPEFDKIKSGLLLLGYSHHGNQGIEDREVFKRRGESTHAILDTIPHHLYVCPAQSQALKNHLQFRDFLRKNDPARLAYQTMKYELAMKANQDKKRYAELKELHMDAFIQSILSQRRPNGIH